jgi:hypothetical protein
MKGGVFTGGVEVQPVRSAYDVKGCFCLLHKVNLITSVKLNGCWNEDINPPTLFLDMA